MEKKRKYAVCEKEKLWRYEEVFPKAIGWKDEKKKQNNVKI